MAGQLQHAGSESCSVPLTLHTVQLFPHWTEKNSNKEASERSASIREFPKFVFYNPIRSAPAPLWRTWTSTTQIPMRDTTSTRGGTRRESQRWDETVNQNRLLKTHQLLPEDNSRPGFLYVKIKIIRIMCSIPNTRYHSGRSHVARRWRQPGSSPRLHRGVHGGRELHRRGGGVLQEGGLEPQSVPRVLRKGELCLLGFYMLHLKNQNLNSPLTNHTSWNFRCLLIRYEHFPRSS